MSLSSALPRSMRSSRVRLGRMAGLVLVGLAILCCMLDLSPNELSSNGAGHHSASSPPMVEAVVVGGADATALTDGGDAHDHGDASCNGEPPQLILGSASSFHPIAADGQAPGFTPVTDMREGPVSQASGSARLPASVPHLLCVMRT
jgi:hypothetical protein